MDKYEVRLMNQALQDLDDIYAYIAGNLLEPGVAAEMVDALESGILSLEYLPYRCSERRTGSFANSGYRQLMVKNYIVIYRSTHPTPAPKPAYFPDSGTDTGPPRSR